MAARRPAGKRRATLAGGAELLSQGSDGSQDGGASASSGSGASHMIVAVRIRPLSKEELAAGKRSCCEVINGNTVVITKAAASGVYLQSQQAKVNEYAFDCAFGPDATQSQVYEATAKPYIEDLLSGINVTVFAYGATGAGKTHTMGSSGTTCGSGGSSSGSGGGGDEAAAASGIMPQSLVDVFKGVEARRRAGSGTRAETWSVRVSYLEVYNEQILDLLEPGGCLQVCEDKARGVVKVAGLAERRVASCDEVLRLLRAGNANRKTEATGANAVSSRSHAVLQVSVTRAHHDDCGNDIVRESKLSLIDLAGSERASATNNTGALLRQGASINKSLLSLANCINTLAQNAARASGGGGSSGGAARAPANVKYRDSKLTRLLKTSLEGRCRVVMIANLNPSHHTYDDSHNTLHYANRAKDIKVDAAAMAPLRDGGGGGGGYGDAIGGTRALVPWRQREERLLQENRELRAAKAELQARVDALVAAAAGERGGGGAAAALKRAAPVDDDDGGGGGAAASPPKRRRLSGESDAAARDGGSSPLFDGSSGMDTGGAYDEPAEEGGADAGAGEHDAAAAVATALAERDALARAAADADVRAAAAEAAARADRAALEACARQLRDAEAERARMAEALAALGTPLSPPPCATLPPALQQQRHLPPPTPRAQPAAALSPAPLGIALTRGRRSLLPPRAANADCAAASGGAAAAAEHASAIVDDNYEGAAAGATAVKRARVRRSSIPRCLPSPRPQTPARAPQRAFGSDITNSGAAAAAAAAATTGVKRAAPGHGKARASHAAVVKRARASVGSDVAALR